jgi:hypothetical protein
MKIRVVRFCALPLVATSQKTPILTPPATSKMGNAFFIWKLKKHKLQKLLGMQCTSPPKMGLWFHNLLWNLHKPWPPGKEDQENSCLEAPLYERVHL